jgi:hypothetical protein
MRSLFVQLTEQNREASQAFAVDTHHSGHFLSLSLLKLTSKKSQVLALHCRPFFSGLQAR